jgi:RND family efflux transporter MFP subunit
MLIYYQHPDKKSQPLFSTKLRMHAAVANNPLPRFLLALVVASTLVACGKGAPDAEPPAALTVTLAKPAQRTIARSITASGSIAPWQEMSLGVEIASTRVARILVDVGSAVKRGQTLIELDGRTLQVELTQARARLAEADAALVLARANAARGRKLKEQQLISAGNADELIAGEARAEAQRQSAVAQLEAAQLRLSFATLKAPDSGVISARSVEPGQIVAPGNEMLRLIRQGRLEWRGELSGADLARVKVGMEVELLAPNGEKVVATVRSVSPSLDPRTRVGLVYADIPQPGALRAGMFAEGRLLLGDVVVMTVPRMSVVVRDGISYVFTLGEGNKVAERRIETGVTNADDIEVRAGLEPSESIVVTGAGFLTEGDRVAVAKESA